MTNNTSGQTKRAISCKSIRVESSLAPLAGITTEADLSRLAAAFQIGIGNLGALASSNVYRTQDKPHYYLGREFSFHSVAVGVSSSVQTLTSVFVTRDTDGVVLGFNVIGLIAAPTYAYLLKRANARKLEEQKTGRDLSIAETLHLGDRCGCPIL